MADAAAQAIIDGEAARLRAEGKTYREIAAIQKCDVAAAHGRVQRAVAAVPSEAVRELKALWLERYEFMYAEAHKVLTTKHLMVSHGQVVQHPETGQPILDDAPVLQAIGTMVTIGARVAKQEGLDAPVKRSVEVLTKDVWAQAMDAMSQGMVPDGESSLR